MLTLQAFPAIDMLCSTYLPHKDMLARTQHDFYMYMHDTTSQNCWNEAKKLVTWTTYNQMICMCSTHLLKMTILLYIIEKKEYYFLVVQRYKYEHGEFPI